MLIKEEDSGSLIDKIYLYAKDLSEPKYQFLMWRSRKHVNGPEAFVKCSAYTDNFYRCIDD